MCVRPQRVASVPRIVYQLRDAPQRTLFADRLWRSGSKCSSPPTHYTTSKTFIPTCAWSCAIAWRSVGARRVRAASRLACAPAARCGAIHRLTHGVLQNTHTRARPNTHTHTENTNILVCAWLRGVVLPRTLHAVCNSCAALPARAQQHTHATTKNKNTRK